MCGISTGALIATFAFLGPEYDTALKEFYTAVTARDICRRRGLLQGLLGDAMTSTKPLRKMIRRYVDKELLEAVAVEYRKGRGFFVGTTNLDARLSVVWDMGKIAASGHPDSLRLSPPPLL